MLHCHAHILGLAKEVHLLDADVLLGENVYVIVGENVNLGRGLGRVLADKATALDACLTLCVVKGYGMGKN